MKMNLLVKNPEYISENSNIHKVDNSEVNRVKFWTDSWIKVAQSKNIIKPDFLPKSKLLGKSSVRLSFLILKAKSIFVKL